MSLLDKKFYVCSLLGEDGRKAWKRYVELVNLVRLEEDKDKKDELISEFGKIGYKYNFGSAIKKDNENK